MAHPKALCNQEYNMKVYGKFKHNGIVGNKALEQQTVFFFPFHSENRCKYT